ncbi:MAG: DinB family protein [Candidatus Heimdallarchaeota archaeon]
MIETLIEKVKINQWANSLFREHLKDKFDELKTLETPYGNFGELVYHISGAVYFWFKRFGKFDFEIKRMNEITSTHELFSQWEVIDQKFVEFISSVDDSESRQKLSYITSKGKKFEIELDKIVLQLNNHSYYHRGQIAYFSRLNGIFLPQTDALVFFRTNG